MKALDARLRGHDGKNTPLAQRFKADFEIFPRQSTSLINLTLETCPAQ